MCWESIAKVDFVINREKNVHNFTQEVKTSPEYEKLRQLEKKTY